ncbi:MAG: sulfite reductase (ferredoxin) [Saprospiraceae bacterium]|jgi:sulfite reductase (ferredoxin)
MQSFRSEIENPIVEQDILDLEKKIALSKLGQIDEEKFRSLRLARGIYGQRQPGVQMIRIKIPFGKMTTEQLLKISDVSDEYSIGRLHTTTRQDIQIHYVSLDRTPELWSELEKSDVTLREACGNCVRNVTASIDAGVDVNELFDVSPYADAIFKFFLRNPVCQEMGRKFKISLSGSDEDNAFAFMHDIGLVAKIKDGVKGFKVMIGGGLGAQPMLAVEAFEFLAADKIIPFIEATLRVFDRYGERSKRLKARIKYLLADIGLEEFMKQTQVVSDSLSHQTVAIDDSVQYSIPNPNYKVAPAVTIEDVKSYATWKKANVKEQKQSAFVSIFIRLTNGDFYTPEARKLAALVKDYAADDIRISINQGLMLRYVQPESLPYVYTQLIEWGMVKAGFDSVADVTACPGTDTCNLGISDSVNTAVVIEELIEKEYPELIHNSDIKIKISGCMNSCGQHSIATIGFHGSTLKKDGSVLPALQVMLGGGSTRDGLGTISDKIIKVPSKRVKDILRYLLNDYNENGNEGEYYNDYYRRQEKIYFYNLLKPLANLETVVAADFIDWGHDDDYVKQIGVGECAGALIDLVATLFSDVEDKLVFSKEAAAGGSYSDAIYHSYSAMVNAAKASLTSFGVTTNTLSGIVSLFDEHVVSEDKITIDGTFNDLVYQMNSEKPTKEFAESYLNVAQEFYDTIADLRQKQLQEN